MRGLLLLGQVDLLALRLALDQVEYRLAVSLDGTTAAEGSVKTVLIDRGTGRAVAWPDDVRAKLSAAGPQRPPD